jgi:hypothetical protein
VYLKIFYAPPEGSHVFEPQNVEAIHEVGSGLDGLEVPQMVNIPYDTYPGDVL